MGFAVFHIEKGKGNGSSIGSHIDREIGREHTYHNADPNRRDLNQHFDITKYSKTPLAQAINGRIAEGYTGKKAIRKDAVRYLSIVMTGTHENMTGIFADQKKKEDWIQANYQYAAQEFGKENILRFSLHMDEKTPHIHLVVVPLTADGRLSAKERMGDRIEMSAKQDRYAQKMQAFGLERGVVGSKAIHNSEGWYLGQQKEKQEAFLADITKFSFLERINPLKKIEKLTEGLKLAIRQKTDAQIEAKRRNAQQRQQALREKSEIKKAQEYKFKLDLVNHKINNYKLKPEYEKMFSNIQSEFNQNKERQKLIKANQEKRSQEQKNNLTQNRGFKR